MKLVRLICSIVLTLVATVAVAHDGHDHGDAPAVGNADGPSRRPDGSVFLPKPAQRQLAVRTVVTTQSELAKTVELNAKVVMDPNAGGKVQAMTAGRLEPAGRGLPSVGQAVRQGEVLAWLRPSVAPAERAAQTAQLAELRAAQTLAAQRLARLRELADTVPRKEIEALESEARGLAVRADAIGGGLSAREALVAPVSGVIASAQAVAGQVVDAREVIWEVVDPQRLAVEALAFDPALGADIAAASVAIRGVRVPLEFVGAARSLREQALPLQFRAHGRSLAMLAVGQPLAVQVQRRQRIRAIALPAASLMKNPANQTVVWVKTAPERFEPRVVTVEPLDGVSVAVTTGLKADERVATRGASLINQIR